MRLLKEFREFAIKGNVIDLAVGVIIGGAFGKITTSLVNDMMMPLLSMLNGKVDFTNLFITIGSGDFATLAEAEIAGVPTINYGIFINNIIQFIIMAFVIFVFIRQINRFKRKEEKESTVLKECTFCTTSIPFRAAKCPYCTSNLE